MNQKAMRWFLFAGLVLCTACSGDDDDNNDAVDDDVVDDDADDDADDDTWPPLPDDDGPPWPYGEPEGGTVFRSSDGLYPIYRIPALITTKSGTLLAFAEGRESIADHSENDIVLRRSLDGGGTWEPHQIIAEAGADCLSDPMPVQIEDGPHSGRVLLFYSLFPEACHHTSCEPGYDGPMNARNYMLTSDDDGLTWQGPTDLTREFRPEDLIYASGGPGFAIQKRVEPHAGRIVLPFRQEPPMEVFAIYSDDSGDTWTRGESADNPEPGVTGDEVQIAEMPDGSLYLNSRGRDGHNLRLVARSEDGGETWTSLAEDEQLLEPVCMASVLQFSGLTDGDTPRLLYSGPNNQFVRAYGIIRLSYDDGETWPVSRIVHPGIFAYSVLTRIDCDTVGVLYEDNIWYHRLRLIRFSLEWLAGGMDRPACE